MYIEKIECPNCNRKGRPGEENFTSAYEDNKHIIICKCGNKFDYIFTADQLILSDNTFSRLEGLSNYFERGTLKISPGELESITFKEKIDLICWINLSPNSPVLAKETDITKTGMKIVCGKWDKNSDFTEPAIVNWIVYGLKNLGLLPTWYLQFYNAVKNVQDKNYRSALFDYAVAFEAFLEEYLSTVITSKYDQALAEYLIKQNQKVEDRCKGLLYFATGKKLSDRDDVYQPWDLNVRQIRNKLFHGNSMAVTEEMTEKAHSAVYQAIRFIQNECK